MSRRVADVAGATSANAQRHSAEQVPAWLLAPASEVSRCPAGAGSGDAAGRRAAASRAVSRRLFTDRLLGTLAAWVERAITSDELARRPGLLQRLDPRVKLVSLLALVVISALATRVTVLARAAGAGGGPRAGSRIGLRQFAARAWLFIPLFTAAIMAARRSSTSSRRDARC